MKKPPYNTTLWLAAVIMWGAFLVPTAFAQSQGAPLILAGQGVLSASSTATQNGAAATWVIDVGQGISGTSTSATVAAKTLHSQDITVTVATYSDAAYTSLLGGCTFATSSNSTIDGPLQLTTNAGCTGKGASISPSDYVQVTIIYDEAGGIPSGNFSWYYGSSNNIKNYVYSGPPAGAGFYPYWDVIGNGFQLTPTASSTGYDLSGAAAFCDSQFASTSSFGIPYGFCVVGGFLFIPSQASFTNFTNIPADFAGAFPFSWLIQMRNILSAATASSSNNFINLSVTVGTSSSSFYIVNVPLISTSSMSKFLPDPVRNTFKTILATSFYLLAALFIYRKLNSIWTTS